MDKNKIIRQSWNVIKFILLIVVIIFFLDVVGGWEGWLSMLLIMLIFTGYRMYKVKDQIRSAIQSFETVLFGKPLERAFWNKGEKPKMKKIKWTWKE